MTPKGQRIVILVIAIVMAAGTLGSFAVMVIASKNATTEQDEYTKQYQRLLEEQQQKAEERQKEAEKLSKEHYAGFKEYESRAASFDASSVGDEVTHIDLKEGDGEVVTEGFNNYRAYYIGWNPDGKVFDGSIEGEGLAPPLNLSEMTLIPGWYDGVEGMKIGGVREITIPATLAYGEKGQGEDIPPNTPIKFVIMTIPMAE